MEYATHAPMIPCGAAASNPDETGGGYQVLHAPGHHVPGLFLHVPFLHLCFLSAEFPVVNYLKSSRKQDQIEALKRAHYELHFGTKDIRKQDRSKTAWR